ncbi:MAG: hypothetical protein ACJ8M4_04775 [Chthoniobacterales bacterium]
METDRPIQTTARAAAEDILRIIYGDDLAGCTVSLDRVTAVIAAAIAGHNQFDRAMRDLNAQAYEAIRMLSTPPPNGSSLQPDELRSLLGDRLDKIQTLAIKVIAATQPQPGIGAAPGAAGDSASP